MRRKRDDEQNTEEPTLLDSAVQHSTLDMQEQDVAPSQDANGSNAPEAPHSARRLPVEEKREEPDGGSEEGRSSGSSSWSWRLFDDALCASEHGHEAKPLAAPKPTASREVSKTATVEKLMAQHAAVLAEKDREIARLKELASCSKNAAA